MGQRTITTRGVITGLRIDASDPAHPGLIVEVAVQDTATGATIENHTEDVTGLLSANMQTALVNLVARVQQRADQLA